MEPYYSDHRASLYRGEALAVLASLPDASIDAVITDPPYSSGGMVRGDRTAGGSVAKYTSTDYVEFSGDNRDARGFAYWMALWVGECRRILRPGGLMLMFTDWRQLPATTDAMQSGGIVWRGILPWHKPNARRFAGRITTECEYAVWGSSGALPNPLDGGKAYAGFLSYSSPQDREHATQKPVSLMRDLLAPVPGGGTVLDPFMGSGTTGVACMIEGRKFVGVEMTAHFAEVAERRIREAQGQAVDRSAQAALDFGAAS